MIALVVGALAGGLVVLVLSLLGLTFLAMHPPTRGPTCTVSDCPWGRISDAPHPPHPERTPAP